MAIDPRISLAVKVPDISSTFNNFLQGIDRNRSQDRQDELQPLRNELLQAQIETAQGQNVEQQQTNRARSLVNLGARLTPLIQSGDLAGIRASVTQNMANNAANKLPSQDSQQVLDVLNSGLPEPEILASLGEMASNAALVGQRMGFTKAPAPGTTSSQDFAEFQQLQQIAQQSGDPLDIQAAKAFGQKTGFVAADKVADPDAALNTEKLQIQVDTARSNLNALATKDDLKATDIRAIQKDVTSLIAEPVKIRNAASRLSKLGQTQTATDQLAAIFTFMKALDPTSVVREGEQQQARSTGGLSDQMVGFVTQIQGEGGLTPKVFNEMIATAKSISNQATTDSRSELQGFVDAFGETIPKKLGTRTMDRLPPLFKLPTKPTTPPSAIARPPETTPPTAEVQGGSGSFTSSGGINFRVK